MLLICCFLSATSGTVEIEGRTVVTKTLQDVRRREDADRERGERERRKQGDKEIGERREKRGEREREQ